MKYFDKFTTSQLCNFARYRYGFPLDERYEKDVVIILLLFLYGHITPQPTDVITTDLITEIEWACASALSLAKPIYDAD